MSILDYERESLLRSICSAPADDMPRLIYADWLDDHGQSSRAHFIRDQIQLARLPKWHPDVLAAGELNRNTSFGSKRDQYELPPLPPGLEWSHTFMQRGFVNAVQCTTPDALSSGLASLCQITPIDSITIKALRGGLSLEFIRALTQIPALACARRLEFSLAMLTPEQLEVLAACPYLTQLEVLDLPFGGLSSRGAITLPTLGLFRRLRELHLRSSNHRDPAGPAFAAAYREQAAESHLEVLDLSWNHIGARDLQFLASAPALASVRELNLNDCVYAAGLRTAGYQALATSKYVQQLEILHLRKTAPTLAGLQALANCQFPNLRYLNLGNNNIGPKGIAVIATAPWVSQLTYLGLSGNSVKDSGLKQILNAQLPNLVAISLRDTKLSEAGMLSLADGPFANQLRQLELHGNPIETQSSAERLEAVFGKCVSFSGQR